MSKRKTTSSADFSSMQTAIQPLADRITSVETQLQSVQMTQAKLEQTLNQNRDVLVELQIQLARKDELEQKLEAQLEMLQIAYERLQNLVDRLRQFVWMATGIIATIQFLAPIVVQWVTK